MINIINYGLNNIFSIKNCLDKLNIKSKIISSPEEFDYGNKLILPFDTDTIINVIMKT